ncbi:MAG: ribulose-phosphate 3-epimerase [Promethearchaeota archaeon]
MKKVAISIHATKDFDPHALKEITGHDLIHVDVMDGTFVRSKNLNLTIFQELKKIYELPILAHMMVMDPHDYIELIIKHVDIYVFHFESKGNKSNIIKLIKKNGKKVGMALNPETPINSIIPFLKELDVVLIMSVNPGWSGQTFIPDSILKVNELARYKKVYDFEIDIDGGINLENAKKLEQVDILSSSSTILKSKNPTLTIQKLKYSTS